jgi:hypothetical protein
MLLPLLLLSLVQHHSKLQQPGLAAATALALLLHMTLQGVRCMPPAGV